MLAPIIIGTASERLSDPAATRATIILVLVELLCIIAVTSKPINKPIKGLDVATRIDSAIFCPRLPKAALSKSMENKNTNSTHIMRSVFLIIFLLTGDKD